MGHIKGMIASCVLVLAGPGPAIATQLTGDVWSVCAFDGLLTWHDTRLIFTAQRPGETGEQVEGFFYWRSNAGDAGTETFVGVLSLDGTLLLQGMSVEGSADLVTSRFLARVSGDGMSIVEGYWVDGAPGLWAARRDGGLGTAVALCDVAATRG